MPLRVRSTLPAAVSSPPRLTLETVEHGHHVLRVLDTVLHFGFPDGLGRRSKQIRQYLRGGRVHDQTEACGLATAVDRWEKSRVE